ncbi:MAG: type II toxin-antitoxin system RelE/ParE family toxin [Thermoanaerobaculia bacterium]|nr:type II toxin-antitoxin system RelE/ParE family toxin [Thermoanaerobaculia bacterium]
MKLQISSEAEQDLVAGARFYEAQAPGLGNYFLDTLSSDIESLRLYAGIHSKHRGHFRLLSKRFPYAIYYRMNPGAIEVRAILDCRRDPAVTGSRLAGDPIDD